jgi:hypothetical protein
MSDPQLHRLLRAAGTADEQSPEMPYGFDTRVVALARSQPRNGAGETPRLLRLLRQVAYTAVAVTAFAGLAAYWQMSENDEVGEPLTNAYAFADSAIDQEFFR